MALPITDTIIAAIAQLVDDSKSGGEYREPTHSDIEFYFGRAGLTSADPKSQGQTVGKAKRVRAVLSWFIDNNSDAGAKLIEQLLSKVRASGGFRSQSPNFVGSEAIQNAIAAFSAEGYDLSVDGDIRPKVLENLQWPLGDLCLCRTVERHLQRPFAHDVHRLQVFLLTPRLPRTLFKLSGVPIRATQLSRGCRGRLTLLFV